MIDFHEIISVAVEPVRVKPKEQYLSACIVESSSTEIEEADTSDIVVDTGEGCGVFHNGSQSLVRFFNLDVALKSAPRKINNLPSACDFIAQDTKSGEFILAELTESKTKSLTGDGRKSEGKISKAGKQLRNTIRIIERVGFNVQPTKKSAIFFFKETNYTADPAATMAMSMSSLPIWRVVTHTTDPQYPGWTFYSHPYPSPYHLQ